ncbi:DUF721 domain-containing protein [bacterium]|nr:DUF721 domain-containing protein [bacterium]
MNRKKKRKRLSGYRKWEVETPRRSGIAPLGKVLTDLVDLLGFEAKLSEQRALSQWTETVGEKIAKETNPISMLNGILKVKVSTPAWRQELIFLKDDIRRKLNKELGKKVVSDIKFS